MNLLRLVACGLLVLPFAACGSDEDTTASNHSQGGTDGGLSDATLDTARGGGGGSLEAGAGGSKAGSGGSAGSATGGSAGSATGGSAGSATGGSTGEGGSAINYHDCNVGPKDCSPPADTTEVASGTDSPCYRNVVMGGIDQAIANNPDWFDPNGPDGCNIIDPAHITDFGDAIVAYVESNDLCVDHDPGYEEIGVKRTSLFVEEYDFIQSRSDGLYCVRRAFLYWSSPSYF